MKNRPLIIFFFLSIFILLQQLSVNLSFYREDCPIFVYCAKNVLLGKKLYVDVIEANPPLVHYLHCPVAFLNLKFSLPEIEAFKIYIISLIILVFILAYYLLFRNGLENSIYQCFLIALVFFNLDVIILFGQREHIIILFLIPYLILRSIRYENYSLSVINSFFAGVLASIAICIKPWYAVLLVLYDFAWLIITRNFKLLFTAENFSILGFMFLYVAHFFFLPKDEFVEYFNHVLPLFLNGYQAINASLSKLFLALMLAISSRYSPVPKYFFLYVAILTYTSFKFCSKNKLIFPAMALLLASMLAFLWQGKWFDYHLIPIQYAFYLLCTLNIYCLAQWLSLKLADNKLVKQLGVDQAKTLLTIFMLALLSPILNGYGQLDTENPEKAAILKYSKPNDKILVISHSSRDLPENYKRISVSKYCPDLYPISEFIYSRSHKSVFMSEAKLRELENKYLNDLIASLDGYKPKLIIINYNPNSIYLNNLAYLQSIGFMDYCKKSYNVLSDPGLYSKALMGPGVYSRYLILIRK